MEIPARYLMRKAVVYIRQSTERQVIHNVGSRQYQERQVEHARRLGWSDDKILVISSDLGRSGMTKHNRPGYRELERLVARGEVGAIFVSDPSRAARKEQILFDLLDLLEEHDVLLGIDGRLTDPHDSSQVFVRKVEALTSARDNRVRTETVHRGRLAKARSGAAVSAPPAGYLPEYVTKDGIPAKTGRWVKDPAHAERIMAVFAAFREVRSLPRAVRLLHARNVLLPSRRRKLVKPTVAMVSRFIKHPAYFGHYVYGRKHWTRVRAGKESPTGRPLLRQYVETPNHHEGYITRDEFEANQAILALNYNAPWRSSLGPGPSLLPGRTRCARHAAMSVAYSGRGIPKRWSFRCPGDALRGGAPCMSVPGRMVEECIVQIVLQVLRGPVIREARQHWRRYARDWARSRGNVDRESRRLEERLAHLKHQLVGRTRRVAVSAMLEDEYEKTAHELAEITARAATVTTASTPFSDDAWTELETLCQDIDAIWSADTTLVQDRQQLVRILISAVIFEHVDAFRIAGRIEWADARAATCFEIQRAPYFHRLMLARVNAGHSIDDIVRELANLGATTQQNRLWCRATVQRTLWELQHGRVKRPLRRRRECGTEL